MTVMVGGQVIIDKMNIFKNFSICSKTLLCLMFYYQHSHLSTCISVNYYIYVNTYLYCDNNGESKHDNDCFIVIRMIMSHTY